MDRKLTDSSPFPTFIGQNLDTKHASHFDHEENQASRDQDTGWRVSKNSTATVDEAADVSQLRWVGTEFIYFLDIPWDHEKLFNFSDTTSEPGQHLSMHSITIGLLEDLMDVTIPAELLLSHDQSDSQLLLADQLSRLVVPWARNLLSVVASGSDSTGAVNAQRGHYSIDRLKSLALALEDAIYSKSGSLLDGPQSDVLCAVAIMFASVKRCIEAIWPDSHVEEIVERTRMFGEVNQILRSKLAERWGWQASFEMERLLSGGLPFAAFALAHDPTPNKVLDVDTTNYKAKHVDPTCTCAFIKPSLSEICEFVRKREVPVVVLDGANLVVRSARDNPYVSISHVWADGLGSTTEEGLPGCQVRRLSRLANSLVPGGAFWQDGLCIPEERQHRKLAIALMAETYADAAKVLVLDEGLRTACNSSTKKELCLLRIATSGWMQRIWTLQEGMLARELYFELTDDIIDCTHFNGHAYVAARKVFPLLEYRRGNSATLTYEPRLVHKPRCSVNDIIGLLRYRTTSHPEDEPIAISGLLGLDTRAIVHIDSAEERMKGLLIRARELPRQLVVFGWFCLRSSLPNFGWAPSSLSDILWPGEPDDPYKAICTEDGLFSNFTVVRFPEISFPEYIGIILRVAEHNNEGQPSGGSKIFNLVLSPFFFRVPHQHNISVGGFLIKGAALPESMREEGVGAVVFPPDSEPVPHPDDGSPTLTCKWAAPASVRFGLPDSVTTSRTRSEWIEVPATVEPLRKVRVT